MKIRETILLGALLLPGSVVAQAADPFAGLDEWLDAEMRTWNVPGLAIAVIRGGEEVLVRGRGYRDVEAELPVDGDTLFAIGSNTKSFTAAAIGKLVEDGALGWDDPVRDAMPEFRLHDDVATAQMTARDLLCHRSGLPRHDLFWYAAPRTREQLVAGLRHLAPSAPFRSRFQYQNLMFVTAGLLAERVSGHTWEKLVETRLMTPLGMDRANFSVHAMADDDNFAQPYDLRGGGTRRIPMLDIDAVGPAGSINASAREMSRWVRMLIAGGVLGETRVLSEATVDTMTSPQMVLTGPIRRVVQNGPEIGEVTYGLGLILSTYRGHKAVGHTGSINGYRSAMEWLPDLGHGVVVLTNTSASPPFRTVVVRQVLDRLLGVPDADWSKRLMQAWRAEQAGWDHARQDFAAAAHEGTSPSHALPDYVGTYEHEAYGRLVVTEENGVLHVAGFGETVVLEHYHYDVFSVAFPEDPAKNTGLEGIPLRFDYGTDGEIREVRMQVERAIEPVVFARVGE